MKKDETDGTCSTHRRNENYIVFVENVKGREHMEDR
jgi:hypothetical protein